MNPRSSPALAGSASGMEAAIRPTTSISATRSRRHSSFSVNSSMFASMKAMNRSVAFSGDRQPNIDASQPCALSPGVTVCSRTDFRRSAPSSLRIQDCSVAVSASNSSPHSAPPPMSSSVGAPVCSGGEAVGTGDGLGVAVGRGVGDGAVVAVGSGVAVGVLTGSAVALGGGSSPHADSKANATKQDSPRSTFRWMSPRNPAGARKANSRICIRRLLPDYAPSV